MVHQVFEKKKKGLNIINAYKTNIWCSMNSDHNNVYIFKII